MLGGVEIQGGKELSAALKSLEAKVARRVTSSALRDGAKLVQAGGQANAPVLSVPRKDRTPGALRDAIKIRAGRRSRSDQSVTLYVGPGRKWFAGPVFYGAFQEFGWKAGPRSSTKGGPGYGKDAALNDRRRQVPGEHYMQYAFEEMGAQAVQAIVESARRRIEQAVGESRSPVT